MVVEMVASGSRADMAATAGVRVAVETTEATAAVVTAGAAWEVAVLVVVAVVMAAWVGSQPQGRHPSSKSRSCGRTERASLTALLPAS